MSSLKVWIPAFAGMTTFIKKSQLAVALGFQNMDFVLFSSGKILKQQSFFLRECSEEEIAKNVKSFIGKEKIRETLLILPRAEIIQKEMALSTVGSSREAMEASLAQSLPYSSQEMAYGLQASGDHGLLYAIPEKKITEILEMLERFGIKPDEIISEDQALGWLTKSSSCLLADQDSQKILFVMKDGDRILFSRTYRKGEMDLEGMFSEISFALIERGQKIGKVVLTGIWNQEEGSCLRSHFQAPAEFVNTQEMSGVLSGAVLWDCSPVISLLPTSQKIMKWQQKQQRLIKDAAIMLLLFFASCFLFLNVHLTFLKQKKARLDKELAISSVQVKSLKEMAQFLQRSESAKVSKRWGLELLKLLAQSMPSSIRLRDLQMESGEIIFRGESPSHALLNETVQVFENTKLLKNVKLEHTRLRKKLNQDYVEFEIGAKWLP